MDPVRPFKRRHTETRTTTIKRLKRLQFDVSAESVEALERIRARYPALSKARIMELIIAQAEREGLMNRI